MSIITIIGSGMMGSAMARPASDNGHQVRLVGSPLDDHIIAALKAGKDHPTLKRSFAGVATSTLVVSGWISKCRSVCTVIFCNLSKV